MALFKRQKSVIDFIEAHKREQSQNKILGLDDPTSFGFTIMFDFEGRDSPLFNETTVGESAIKYLDYAQESDRSKMLKSFKDGLRNLLQNSFYSIKSISGLDNLYKFENNAVVKDINITIDFYESLDLRIGKLIEDYTYATYDFEYHRNLLPRNLKWFRFYIIISEIRKFRTFVGDNYNGTVDDMKMASLNEHLSAYVYEFDSCEFDTTESNPFLATINNDKTEGFIDNKITIKSRAFNILHKMNLIDMFIDRNAQKSTTQSATNMKSTYERIKSGRYGQSLVDIENRGNLAANNFVSLGPRLINNQLASVDALVNRISLGNVYNLNTDVTNTNVGNIISRLSSVASNDVGKSILALILGGSTFSSNPLRIENVTNVSTNVQPLQKSTDIKVTDIEALDIQNLDKPEQIQGLDIQNLENPEPIAGLNKSEIDDDIKTIMNLGKQEFIESFNIPNLGTQVVDDDIKVVDNLGVQQTSNQVQNYNPIPKTELSLYDVAVKNLGQNKIDDIIKSELKKLDATIESNYKEISELGLQELLDFTNPQKSYNSNIDKEISPKLKELKENVGITNIRDVITALGLLNINENIKSVPQLSDDIGSIESSLSEELKNLGSVETVKLTNLGLTVLDNIKTEKPIVDFTNNLTAANIINNQE